MPGRTRHIENVSMKERKRQKAEESIGIDQKSLVDAGSYYFLECGYTCSESICKAALNAMGIKSATLINAAAGFGGGIGNQGHTCGAITGAVMVISLALSKREHDRGARKRTINAAVQKFFKTLQQRFGPLECRSLTGLNLTKEQDYETLIQSVMKQKCLLVFREVARQLATTLNSLG